MGYESLLEALLWVTPLWLRGLVGMMIRMAAPRVVREAAGELLLEGRNVFGGIKRYHTLKRRERPTCCAQMNEITAHPHIWYRDEYA